MDQAMLTQNIYRDLLLAMSRPGTVRQLCPEVSSSWNSGLTAIAATLIDQEVRFCVVDDESLAQAIGEETRGRCSKIEEADYILAPLGTSRGLIGRVRRGVTEYPDQGATVIYQVEELETDGNDSALMLQGPGIKETAKLSVRGADLDDLLLLSDINSQYPLGVDVLLVDRQNQVAAIPRSVSLAPECSRPETEQSKALPR